MFNKKPSSTQQKPYQVNTSNIYQKLKTPISSSKYSKPIHQSINHPNQSSHKRTPQYANRSRNSGYHQEQQNDYIAEDSYRSEQQSTLSYNQYRDIVNNLLENGQQDVQWVKMPQTLKLVIKALHLSINALESKLVQNREIINEQGLQFKDHHLQLQQLNKNVKKINLKLVNSSTELKLTQQNRFTPTQKNNEPLTTSNLYTKGLDMIMIQQVKTITDAIFSQKYTEIINQVNEASFKLQQKIIGQIQQLKDKLKDEFTTNKQVQETRLSLNQQLSSVDKRIKQRLTVSEEQIQHLNRQLMNEKQAMCDLAQYLEDTFITKTSIQDLLKSNQHSQPKAKPFNETDMNNNPILSRNKIDQIVKNHLDGSTLFVKRKQFEQFRDKINSQLINFPTVSQVQAIVDKSTKTKLSKMHEMNQMYIKSNITKEDEQPTLQLKKSKYYSKQQDESKRKSPNLNKKKSETYKTSQSRLQLSKVSKPSKHTKRTSSNYDEHLIESSPVSDHNKSKSNKFKESKVQNINGFGESKEKYEKLWGRFQAKINKMVLEVKQECDIKVQKQSKSLEKRVIKRLQAAQEEFCSIVQQNWKTMSANNLKVQKADKQNMQHLLNIFSILNVVARYTTIVSCKPNECIRWDKQIFNAQNKTFYLNSQKTHLYIATAGVYEVHIVLYTLYDPVISFGIELNSEEIFNSANGKEDRGLEKQTGGSQIGQLSKREKKSKLVRKGTHPSRGVEYWETLLIPAKSHLVVRMAEQINGQGLIQIRKL